MKRLLAIAREFLLPALLIFVVMAWLGGAFHPPKLAAAKLPEPTASAANQEARVVTAATVAEIAEAVGTVQAQRKTTVAARVTANVLRVAVSAGQRVRAGDVLVQLDDRDLQAKARGARASVRRAEATRDLALADFKRDRVLREQDVVPESVVDVTTMRVRTSAAEVAALQDVVHDAEVVLGYALIKSPYDGVVIDRNVEPGDLATPGKPLLTLYESDRQWLEAAVPEENVTALRIGATYRVRIDALKRDLDGKLLEIVPASDPASRTVTARVTLPVLSTLYPGLFGRLLVPVGERLRLSVPESSILRAGQLTMVDLVVGGSLQRRSVQLGDTDGGEIEILSGLAPGDRVSLSPRKEIAP
jgi:RND family efflux transporter MFP subunit